MKTAEELLNSKEDDRNWAPLLELAAKEVFHIMLGCELGAAAGAEPEEQLDVTAMVGLAGRMCGVMSVRCSRPAALRMASKMLGIEAGNEGQEMWDAVGEVGNMVAGNFKNKITGLSDHCLLSVPTVITGCDYNMHSLAISCRHEVRLMFEGMPIVVSLEVHS